MRTDEISQCRDRRRRQWGGDLVSGLHYGRDALVGIAFFLSHLAKSGKTCSDLKKSYPEYHISKNKIELTPEIDVDDLLVKMKNKYADQPVNDVDGVKIEFGSEWVHLRNPILNRSFGSIRKAPLKRKCIGEQNKKRR